MSDLAPFVAAALRDRVVLELQEEVRDLQRQVAELRNQSQCVSITGPRGSPVYAKANFSEHGNFDLYQPELWKVEFLKKENNNRQQQQQQQPQQQAASATSSVNTSDTISGSGCCTLDDLAELQIRVGGICKARMLGTAVEAFVNDVRNNYDPIQKSGAVSIWFGGSSGIWLTIRIQPMERAQYASLRDFDLGEGNLVATLQRFFHDNRDRTLVYFSEVSFLVSYMNGAMEKWGLLAARSPSYTNNNDDQSGSRNNNRIEQTQTGIDVVDRVEV